MRRGNFLFPVYFSDRSDSFVCLRLVAYSAKRCRRRIPRESDHRDRDCDSRVSHNIDTDIEPEHEDDVAHLK